MADQPIQDAESVAHPTYDDCDCGGSEEHARILGNPSVRPANDVCRFDTHHWTDLGVCSRCDAHIDGQDSPQ